MTEEDKYALKELLRGVGVFAGASAVFIVILIVLAYLSLGGKPADQKFQVVDTYKGCDVVQYNNQMDAKYHYFLHCK